MTTSTTAPSRSPRAPRPLGTALRTVLRGVSQIFFLENSLSGALILVVILLGFGDITFGDKTTQTATDGGVVVGGDTTGGIASGEGAVASGAGRPPGERDGAGRCRARAGRLPGR